MKYLKIALSMAFFVPVFVTFGLQGWAGDWYGGVVGGIIGVFFGLVFSGEAKGRWLDTFYPPEPQDRENRQKEPPPENIQR